MFDKLAWIKESYSLLAKRAVITWLIILFSTCAFFLVSSGGYGPSSLEGLFNIAGGIEWLLITGVPFLFGASLLFSSQETKNNIAETTSKGEVKFFHLFVTFLILILFSTSIISIIGVSFVAFMPGNSMIFQYLLPVIGVTLLLSLLMTPIYLLLALAVDNNRISIIIGLVISLAAIIAFGQPRYPVNYPEVAFFQPAHIFSALLFILIGGYGAYDTSYYVGTLFTPLDLALPIMMWVGLFFIGYFGSRMVYGSNLPRWFLEWNDWIVRNEALQSQESPARSAALLKAEQSLDSRRKKAIAVAIIIIFLVPFVSTSYVQTRQQEWTQIVYESPSGGETLTIGEWIFDSFTGIEPPPSKYMSLGCVGRILNWGSGSGYLEFAFEHRAMSLTEFQNLNETEFEELFGHSSCGNYGTTGSFGSGWGGPINAQEYVWVLRFTDVNGRTSGTIDVWFQLIIRLD